MTPGDPGGATDLTTASSREEGGFRAIELAHHEFEANYIFVEHGLAPFFAAGRFVTDGDGSPTATFQVDGERWRVTLYAQDSGLVHPGEQLPTGTDWPLDQVREYWLSVQRHPDEDPVGQQGFKAHLAPRWQDMHGKRTDGTETEIPVPAAIEEGVNVRVTGSNIAFTRYLDLLQRAASAVGMQADAFRRPHPHSIVQDAEKYARVHKAASGPVHARDGPIATMGHLLEHDRSGYRRTVQNDRDTHGVDRPGFYHTVTLDPRRVREVFPNHQLAVEVKHYYAKEAENLPDDDPLAHPKVGASYQVAHSDGKVGVSEEDLAQLEAELDRMVYSVLAEAGINLAPSDAVPEAADIEIEGMSPYVPDAYFDAVVREQSVEPVALNVDRIRHSQESVVITHLADGMSPVAWEALETLVTDGGQVAPTDIAAEHGRHVESVRRALRQMDDLVDQAYGAVRLKSDHIAELVHDAVEEAREAPRQAANTTARAKEVAERGLQKAMGAFIAWADHHGVDVTSPRGARMKLRFHGVETSTERNRLINEGYEVWTEAEMPAEHYREAQVRFGDGSIGTAWRWLTR